MWFPGKKAVSAATEDLQNEASDAAQPDRFVTHIALADAARDRHDWVLAARNYEMALAAKPDDASIWVQLGNMSKDARDFGKARLAYSRALDLRPNDADTHLQIGHLHKLAGDKAEALSSYTLASRLDPNNKQASAELSALQSFVGGSIPANPPPAVSKPSTSPSGRDQRSRKLPFDAKVLQTRNALQDLLVYSDYKTKPGLSHAGDANSAILNAIAALDDVIQGGKIAGASQMSTRASAPIVFDVSDLFQYFRHHRLPTGIQRVQIEAISVALLNAHLHKDVRVCCFTENVDGWREIPPETFLELCEMSLTAGDWAAPEWRDLIDDVDLHLHQEGEFRFGEGAFLINIGTSWWLQNYFLQVREAKRRSSIRYVPFVHDMIPIMTPEYCVEGLVKDFISWAQGVYNHADFYFVNSESTKRDLIAVGKRLGFEVDPERVRTVRLDADYRKAGLANDPGSLRRHRLIPGDYVLFVSTIEARKNHVAVFDAWLNMCKEHGDHLVPKLVCVGSNGWLNEAVYARLASSRRLRDKVVMLSHVSDGDLATLYQNCLFSVYPSFYEGWGLPVTEALSYGKPVLAAESSSLPEAGGEFADYFELGDFVDLSAKLQKLVFDREYRNGRQNRIRTDFRPRSWKGIAQDFQSAVMEWSAQNEASRRGLPKVSLGRYYAFARNEEISIFPGMQSGEVFRSGSGWWGANEWGCWLKPGPAEIGFALPDCSAACRLYLGLRNATDTAAPFDLTVLSGAKIAGVLKAWQTRWVIIELDGSAGRDIEIVVEGFNRHKEQPRSDLDSIEVSIAAIGLFVCAVTDMEARARFSEAVALDDLRNLSRAGHGQSAGIS